MTLALQRREQLTAIVGAVSAMLKSAAACGACDRLDYDVIGASSALLSGISGLRLSVAAMLLGRQGHPKF